MWLNANTRPPFNSGFYLVVAEGHGKRKMVVDCYNIDDIQWEEERKDGDVAVTHYRELPDMPPKKVVA